MAGVVVFLSASIPEPGRWDGNFNPLEITDAVIAATRAILTESGRIVCAAHPTIAPLLLYVAAEFPSRDTPSVIIYQSRLFSNVLPEATKRFEDSNIGTIRWTDAEPGDYPQPGSWDKSLTAMRQAMLRETDPAAAIFIGGMDGLIQESRMFWDLARDRPWYAAARPGGVARSLAKEQHSPLAEALATGDVYPALFREVIADIARHVR